jgi:outer membrane protein OmpA-like peptidoglycan-associated protein
MGKASRYATWVLLGAGLTLGTSGCLATQNYVDERDTELRTALTARLDGLDRDVKATQERLTALGARVDAAEASIKDAQAGAASAQNRADQAHAKADQVGAAVESAGANRFKRARVSEVAVAFETGKAVLSRRAVRALDGVVSTLAKNPTYTLDILGYTEQGGDDNATLTLQRAETVRRYLIDHGVEMNRMYDSGMGDAASARKRDRHVGIRILKPTD